MVDLFVDDECVNIDLVKLILVFGSILLDFFLIYGKVLIKYIKKGEGINRKMDGILVNM